MKLHPVIQQSILLPVAIFLIGVSINMFLGPHHIAAGGVSGIGILVEATFGLSRALIVLILNTALLLLAFIFLGKEIFLKTIIGSMLLPLALALIPEVMVTQDKFLSALCGSALFALAITILYRVGASSGGTTIPPLILRKYFGISTSIGLLITDALIVTMSFYVFGVEAFLYAIFTLIMTSIMMNYIETGLDKKKMMMIVSDAGEDIMQDIMQWNRQSVRVIPKTNGKAPQGNEMFIVVFASREYLAIMKVIDGYDKHALVVVSNVSDVHGLNVSYQTLI